MIHINTYTCNMCVSNRCIYGNRNEIGIETLYAEVFFNFSVQFWCQEYHAKFTRIRDIEIRQCYTSWYFPGQRVETFLMYKCIAISRRF